MRLSDERYNGMVETYRKITSDCNEVETLGEFVEKFSDKYDIDDSNVEDGFIVIDDCGDEYTVNDEGYGLEVDLTVRFTNDEWRCPDEVTLERNDVG